MGTSMDKESGEGPWGNISWSLSRSCFEFCVRIGRALSFVCKKSDLNSPQVLGCPSKPIGLFIRQSIIFRSDSNGEDLEGYAEAGLYNSVPMDEEVKVVLDYLSDPLIIDAKFRQSILSSIAVLEVQLRSYMDFLKTSKVLSGMGKSTLSKQDLRCNSLFVKFVYETNLARSVSVGQKQPWCSVVWFHGNVPKLAFIAWLACCKRLATKDRLREWGMNVHPTCVLCQQQTETHTHLFFYCNFSGIIWSNLVVRLPGDWDFEIVWFSQHCRGKSLHSSLCKLSLAATLYYIWLE